MFLDFLYKLASYIRAKLFGQPYTPVSEDENVTIFDHSYMYRKMET